ARDGGGGGRRDTGGGARVPGSGLWGGNYHDPLAPHRRHAWPLASNSCPIEVAAPPFRTKSPVMSTWCSTRRQVRCRTCSARQIKTYAVLAKSRWLAAPDIPTSEELGVPGINISFWHGLWVVKGLLALAAAGSTARRMDGTKTGNEAHMRFLCRADGVAWIARRVCPVCLP